MKLKFKSALLVGALALSAVGQANAAITSNGTFSNDLVLSVWDQTNNTSYTANLGVTMQSFLNGLTFGGTSLAPVISGTSTAAPFSFTDASLISFLSTASANTTWSVIGVNMDVLGYGTAGVMATSSTVPPVQASTALAATAVFNQQYIPTVNGIMGSGNFISTTAATGGLAYVGAASNGMGNNLGGGLSFNDNANVGASQSFYFFTPTTNSRGSYTGNAASVAFGNTFTLTSAGLQVASVAAVPEPGEWLLMLSGFGLIGFIATRRKNEGSMAFA